MGLYGYPWGSALDVNEPHVGGIGHAACFGGGFELLPSHDLFLCIRCRILTYAVGMTGILPSKVKSHLILLFKV